MISQFNPELKLSRHEQGALALVVAEEGYQVIHKICKTEIDKFILRLINEDATDPGSVLEAHRIAKAAAQFYAGITNVIKQNVEAYMSGKTIQQAPVDLTEGILDIGPVATTLEMLSEEGADDEY